jgi:molybdate transport system substrate-binding protein
MGFARIFSVMVLALVGLLAPCRAFAEEIRVAVASNFQHTLSEIATRFETTTGHEISLISGSTGKHFAQIMNGAPFDAFFAADAVRPERLVMENRALKGSRFTYARGQLALWSPAANYVDSSGEVLKHGSFRHLAIANPALAPYGEAALEVLEALGLRQELDSRLVRGENIGQAFLFVSSGNAELGFVALSQLNRRERPVEGSFWLIPEDLYRPIEQQAVLLRDNEAARAFMSFVQSKEAAGIIRAHGYDIAE